MKESILDHLRGGMCQVEFIKKNGERRIMIGTLDQRLIPADKFPKQTDSAPVVEEVQPAQLTDQIRLFDIEANAWRSFTLAGFIGIAPRYTGVAIED
jgi:hypothetical protein